MPETENEELTPKLIEEMVEECRLIFSEKAAKQLREKLERKYEGVYRLAYPSPVAA